MRQNRSEDLRMVKSRRLYPIAAVLLGLSLAASAQEAPAVAGRAARGGMADGAAAVQSNLQFAALLQEQVIPLWEGDAPGSDGRLQTGAPPSITA